MSKKTVLGAVAAVLLGALGSGFWELAKPVLGWGWLGLLTVATLGLDSLRDGMYADAARNVGLRATVLTRIQALAGLMLTTAALILLYIRAAFPHSSARARAILWLLMAGVVTMTVGAARGTYIEGLANYATRLTVIVAPYVSEADLKKYHSELAQVSSRVQYLRVVEELRAVIRRNGPEPPARDFF